MSSNVVELVPRSPIIMNQRSGTLDAPANYLSTIRTWRAAARQEALMTQKLNPEKDFLRDYIDMLEGRFYDRRRPRYRSTFFDNRLAEARLEVLSALTDIRPSMEISCSSGVEEYVKQAEILQKVILSIWSEENLDLKVESVIDHALLSVGYWKVGATMASAGTPARMIVLPCGMDMVLPIQPGTDIQNSTAVLYRSFWPLHRVKQAYGMSAESIDREITGSSLNFVGGNYPDGNLSEYTYSPLNPASRQMQAGRGGISMASEAGAFASVEVEEYWIDDPTINESSGDILVKDPRLSLAQHNYHYIVPRGQRLFPRKRLLVMAGSTILYDGPAPFWHGLYPFAQLVLRPAVWRSGGMSYYRNLVPLQLAINKIGAGVLDVSERCVDPQMAFSDGALDDTSFRNFYADRHGAQIKMASRAQWGRDARYIDPPMLPAYVGAFSDRVSQAFDRQSGSLDVGSLTAKNQTPGGDSVQAYVDSMGGSSRLDSRHLEPFLRDAGRLFIACVFQFWNREQRMRMLGRDGLTWQDFDYNPGTMAPWSAPMEDHWRRFSLNIAAGSMHGGKKDRDRQVAIALYSRNAISRQQLLRTLDIPNIDQILKEIEEEQPVIPPEGVGKGAAPRLTRGARVGNPYAWFVPFLIPTMLCLAALAERIMT